MPLSCGRRAKLGKLGAVSKLYADQLDALRSYCAGEAPG